MRMPQGIALAPDALSSLRGAVERARQGNHPEAVRLLDDACTLSEGWDAELPWDAPGCIAAAAEMVFPEWHTGEHCEVAVAHWRSRPLCIVLIGALAEARQGSWN